VGPTQSPSSEVHPASIQWDPLSLHPVRSTQPHVQGALEGSSRGVRRHGHEAEHSLPTCPEAKNTWFSTATPHQLHTGQCSDLNPQACSWLRLLPSASALDLPSSVHHEVLSRRHEGTKASDVLVTSSIFRHSSDHGSVSVLRRASPSLVDRANTNRWKA
jgi:hypothetical protein